MTRVKPSRSRKGETTTVPNSQSKSRRRINQKLWLKLEPQLGGLDFESQEFACRICTAFICGQSKNIRNNFKTYRKQLKQVAQSLERLRTGLIDLQPALTTARDEIRFAYTPRGVPMSVNQLMGLNGSKDYFDIKSLPDPAGHLETLLNAVQETVEGLSSNISYIDRQIPGTQALWKARPELSWEKGGLEYLLLRLLTERHHPPLSRIDAHKKIVEIVQKIDNRVLNIQDTKYSSAIRQAINRMPREYKRTCDRVFASILGSRHN
jgi:hypothetical protein